MSEFAYLKIPAGLLKNRRLSGIEKMILADIGYFQSGEYRFTNEALAAKFGVGKRTIINSIQRLSSAGLIDGYKGGRGRHIRRLKLTKKGTTLFNKESAESALLEGKGKTKKVQNVHFESAKAALLGVSNSAKVAPIDNNIDNNKTTKKGRATFKKPTLIQIEQHIREKGYSVNAETFFNHYESNGWKVGRNAMKNWQACLAQWNARSKNNEKQKPQRDYTQTPQEGVTVLSSAEV